MTNSKRCFSRAVIDRLKYYVYLYSHPITGVPFYIGKGKANRVFSHLDDPSESQKCELIREIRSNGLEPKVEILIHALDDEETALKIESSIIDLIGKEELTNKQLGYRSAVFGRMSIDQVNAAYNKQSVTILEPSVLIRINQAFRYSMAPIELYDYTRGQWKLNPEKAKLAKYAFSVFGGVVQEVYEILDWYRAGQTMSVRKDSELLKNDGAKGLVNRYEFIGNLAIAEIRGRYRNKSVEHYFRPGNANPIMYLNLD